MTKRGGAVKVAYYVGLDNPVAAVAFDGNVVVGVVRVRRGCVDAARPGVVTELINRVLKANGHVPVLLLRLVVDDIDLLVKSVLRSAGVKDVSTTGHVAASLLFFSVLHANLGLFGSGLC